MERTDPRPGDTWCRRCGRLIRDGIVIVDGNSTDCGYPMEIVQADAAGVEDAEAPEGTES